MKNQKKLKKNVKQKENKLCVCVCETHIKRQQQLI